MNYSVSDINKNNFEEFLKNNSIKEHRRVMGHDSARDEKIIDCAKSYLSNQKNSSNSNLKLKA